MGTRDELARGCQWGAERDAELVVQCIHATNYHSGPAVASSSTTKVSSDNINQSYGFTSRGSPVLDQDGYTPTVSEILCVRTRFGRMQSV